MGSFFSSLFGSNEGASRDREPSKPKPTERPKEGERTPSQPADSEEGDFASALLKAQNEYRRKHGVEPLSLDRELCKEAQKWADKLAETGRLQHAETEDGENLAFAGPTLSAQKAADMWYDEIKDYDFSKPGFTGGTGHFTQVVWAGSKQFGAGVAKSSNGMYAVGRYRPAGNITNAGQFEANVLPAK